jgi:serine protease Do
MLANVAVALALCTPSQLRRTPVVEVVEKAGPAVVNIGAEVAPANPFFRGRRRDNLWRDFFGGRQSRRQKRAESLGSGVIIDANRGLVLTNEHVVARAAAVTITLSDRRTFPVDVVGADPEFDIAVLRIRRAENLPQVELGASGDIMPGEPAIAIGNPFGLSNTVTTGVVSALHRSIRAEERTYEDFIQTDAAINPGNSGGALLNIEGKLIGINTAIHSGGTGIGFAIPIDKALAVVDEVLRYGEVRPVYLGVDIDPLGRDGAVISKVERESAAARAGLRQGDRVVDIGGQQIKGNRSFGKVVRGLVPGQTAAVTFIRRGATRTTSLVVREMTFERAAALGRRSLGLSVRTLKNGGLEIVKVRKRSHAAVVGIRPGDILYSVAGRPLSTLEQLDKICAAIREASAVAIVISRGGRRYYATLRLG